MSGFWSWNQDICFCWWCYLFFCKSELSWRITKIISHVQTVFILQGELWKTRLVWYWCHVKEVEGAFCGVKCLNLLSDSIKILGVHFSYSQSLYNDRNYLTVLKSVQEVLNLWSARGLTLAGRIQVFKTFGISKILYISYMNQVPPHIIEELKKSTLHLFGRAKNQKLSILHVLET